MRIFLVVSFLVFIAQPVLAENFSEGGYDLHLEAFQDHSDLLYISGRVGLGPNCRDLQITAYTVGSAGDRVKISARVEKAGIPRKIVYGEFGKGLRDQRWKIEKVWVNCLYK